eukprot:jgi/Ulvmu1/4884/UM020_0170.1
MMHAEVANQGAIMLPEDRRHAPSTYEAALPSAKVAKLERQYVAKAKKHNLSPQDLLHVLPHRSLDSLRTALNVKSTGRTQAKKASSARAFAASAQQAKAALSNAQTTPGVAASFRPVLRGFATADGQQIQVLLNEHCADHGDNSQDRVRRCTEIPASEKGMWMKNLTIATAHGEDLARQCILLSTMSVADSDECDRLYSFSLAEPHHCPCFRIGVGGDGTPLLSWSRLKAMYRLPNGQVWAEHEDLWDTEDLRSHAASVGKTIKDVELQGFGEAELVLSKRRVHSRVANVEYECFVYDAALPSGGFVDSHHEKNSYFWKRDVDPTTLMMTLVHE